jgi:hypothetical protein
MKHRWVSLAYRPAWALGLVLAASGALAQGQQDAARDWRLANETVGQYLRGHADVLRWEQAHAPATPVKEGTAPGFALATASEAVRAAWKVHRDLASPLARLGAQNVDQIAAGHWGSLDPSLQRRVSGADEVLEVAARTCKAWITAVAARQTLQHLQDAATAAEAAAELGRRMVSVGNWSRHQHAQIALGDAAAQLELQRGQLAAQQAEWALLKAMGLETVHERVALPARLPDLPKPAIDTAELQRRLTAIQGQLPRAEGLKAPGYAAQAHAAYTASLSAHRNHRENLLKQREIIGEETQLRYNGMLESVWGLLADVGARSQAVVAAIGAQRDALLAETDLQWVLQGGQPEAFVSLGGGTSSASAAAGH